MQLLTSVFPKNRGLLPQRKGNIEIQSFLDPKFLHDSPLLLKSFMESMVYMYYLNLLFRLNMYCECLREVLQLGGNGGCEKQQPVSPVCDRWSQ